MSKSLVSLSSATPTMKNYVLLTFLLLSLSLPAQKIFMKAIGGSDDDQGYGIAQTADGNFMTTGFTKGLSIGTRPFCSKYDGDGNLLWSKATAYLVQEKAYCITPTADGGVIIGGEGKYCVNANCGTDAFAMKLNTNGDFQWMKGYGGIAWDEIQDIKQTVDGGYIMAGSTVSYGIGSYDWLLIKTNGNGDTLWTRTYGLVGTTYGEERAYSVLQNPDGGYLVCGYLYVGNDNNNNNYWSALIRTNANGDVLWAKTYHAQNMSIDKGMNVLRLQNGNYLLATHTSLLRIDANNGDVLQSKKLPTGFTFVGGQWSNGGVSETADGSGLLLCGGTGGDACLLKCDYDFNLLWSKKYTQDGNTNWDFLHKARQIADGRILVSGYVQGKGAGSFDNLLIATDDKGNVSATCSLDANLPNFGSITTIAEPQTPQTRRGVMMSSPNGTVEDLSAAAIQTAFCSEVYTDVAAPYIPALKLYPNPSSGLFSFHFPTEININKISLFNLWGATVWQIENPKEYETDLSHLPAGTYFYHVSSGQGEQTGRWVKE